MFEFVKGSSLITFRWDMVLVVVATLDSLLYLYVNWMWGKCQSLLETILVFLILLSLYSQKMLMHDRMYEGLSLFTFVKFLLPILWWVVPGWSGTNHHCIHQEQPGLTAAGAASDGGTWCMCTCWYYLVQGFSTHSWNPLQVLLMYSIYGQQKRRRVSPRHENFEEESHGACNTFLQKSGVRVHLKQ